MKNKGETRARPAQVEIPGSLESGRSYEVAIGVGDSIEAPAVVQFASEFKFRQIVQSSGHDYDLEVLTSELMLTRPEVFVENPLSSILDPLNASPERELEVRAFGTSFSSAKEKKKILDDLEAYALGVSRSESLTADIRLAADELITNAIYNAPHVNYEQNGPGAPRTRDYGDSPNLRPGSIFVGHNEKRLILGCTDAYGTLNPNHFIVRLKKCYEDGATESMNVGTGGAGLGTFLMFQSALSMYVGVSVNRRTVVCCAYSLERRARVRAALPKNLHLCPGSDSTS